MLGPDDNSYQLPTTLGKPPSILWPNFPSYNNMQLNNMFSKVLSVLSSFNIGNFHVLSLHQPSPPSLPPPKLIKFPLAIPFLQKKRGKLDLGR